MNAESTGRLDYFEMLDFTPDGEVEKKMGSAFFRGENCNFNPYLQDHLSPDFFSRFLMNGWSPKQPFINSDTKITAFGSCFAENITNHLIAKGFALSKSAEPNIHISRIGEGIVNVYALLQQFEWAFEGAVPATNLWHGFQAEEYGYDETVRLATRNVFLNTDVFILTFGLSEIWYDEQTGGIFWRAVPMKFYDAARHKFRVCSFDETKRAIQRIIELVTRYVPSAKLIMTVSPIPLAATFRPISCQTATSASKAILRSAIDEIMREHNERVNRDLFYFPAFELVSEHFANRFVEDGRHLHAYIIQAAMQLFESYFCENGISKVDAELALRVARIRNLKESDQFHQLYRNPF